MADHRQFDGNSKCQVQGFKISFTKVNECCLRNMGGSDFKDRTLFCTLPIGKEGYFRKCVKDLGYATVVDSLGHSSKQLSDAIQDLGLLLKECRASNEFSNIEITINFINIISPAHVTVVEAIMGVHCDQESQVSPNHSVAKTVFKAMNKEYRTPEY
ncbi:hypothetical protein BG011_009996 [Mortierella polycephala]|uniref:Uncharacterized protein n=1 Tax=Mortierella polycephala TaxID=41804 RepID=A0A9P6TVT1_9FUNG|nr:hypothetical protein BG011_009996 [Mortierella polycephala]